MKAIKVSYQNNKKVLFPLFAIVAVGVVTNFILAAALMTLIFLTIRESLKLEVLFVLFVVTFFLGDNFSGRLAYNQNLRFVILGLSLAYLFKYKVFSNILANKILPFSIIALLVSILFSPVGLASFLRAISFWLVAVSSYGFVVNSSRKQKNIHEILVLIIFIYYGITLIFYFVPVLNVTHSDGRFKGMMGNPNGLGLLSIFCFGIVDYLKVKKETIFTSRNLKVLKYLIFIVVVLTGSRTAFFSILIYEIIVRFNKNFFLMFLALSVTSVFYIILSSIGFEVLVSSLGLNEFLRVDTLENASGRTDVWKVAWEEVKRSPLLGKGILYDTHFILGYAKQTFGARWDRQWNGVWSSYLSLLLDVGIVGFIAYFYFVFTNFIKSKDKSLAVGFLIMSLFSGITESWMAASMNAFTPMFFIYWALQSTKRDNPS